MGCIGGGIHLVVLRQALRADPYFLLLWRASFLRLRCLCFEIFARRHFFTLPISFLRCLPGATARSGAKSCDHQVAERSGSIPQMVWPVQTKSDGTAPAAITAWNGLEDGSIVREAIGGGNRQEGL